MNTIRSPPNKKGNLEEILNILGIGLREDSKVRIFYGIAGLMGISSCIEYLRGFKDVAGALLIGTGIILYESFAYNLTAGKSRFYDTKH